MAKDIDLISDEAMNHVISKLEVVNMAVWEETEKIGARARGNLAGHRETGEARIEVTFEGGTDGLVSLVDVAAESIEWGHWFTGFGWANPAFPRFVAGLYIITRAAGLI
jgi:hypothetical protein